MFHRYVNYNWSVSIAMLAITRGYTERILKPPGPLSTDCGFSHATKFPVKLNRCDFSPQPGTESQFRITKGDRSRVTCRLRRINVYRYIYIYIYYIYICIYRCHINTWGTPRTPFPVQMRKSKLLESWTGIVVRDGFS